MSLPERMLRALFRSPLYPLSLRGARAGGIIAVPPDHRPGDPEIGAAVLAGRYPSPGGLRERGPDPWGQSADEGSDATLHGFSWLRDLIAVDSEIARERARALIAGWLARHDCWHPVAWRADVMGERLAGWLVALPSVAGTDATWTMPVLASIARQARHLARIALRIAESPHGFSAARGLIVVGTSLDGQDRALAVGLATLARALALQVLPDGGHISRNPKSHLTALEKLNGVREVLAAAGQDVPVPLQGAIERMAPFLRAMRLGDGGFALFNGARENIAARIDAALSQSGARRRALASAPHSGYQRLAAGRTAIVVDVGGPPPAGFDAAAHAAPLAFEMSVGRRRLIVNCGANPDRTSPWHHALKATAAHSTVTIDDSHALVLGAEGIEDHAVSASCQRRESDGNTVIEAHHDGYRARFGIVHRRDIYLSVDGFDVRGRDILEGTGRQRYVVRFHLHPDVKASLLEDGASTLLRLGDGEGWRLRASGGQMALEESIYYGSAEPRRSQQVAVVGALAGAGAEVKWALRREGGD